MRVLFCRPASPQRQPDGFDLEADALDALGIEALWIDTESVVDENLEPVLDELAGTGDSQIVLRSWMLTEGEYEYLYAALAERGYYLVNDPAAYAAAHYLPAYYDAIEPWAARTRWIEGTDLDEAWDAARQLGPGPYLLKDHVKSAKEVPEISAIPANATRDEFDRVCTAFIDYRGERFERGLVFRAVLPLAPLATGDAGETVFDEYRLFFWNGALAVAVPYYDVAGDCTDFSQFEILADRIGSSFFTVDIARLSCGSWSVIEVGDGGVSTMPPNMDPRDLYRVILESTEG